MNRELHAVFGSWTEHNLHHAYHYFSVVLIMRWDHIYDIIYIIDVDLTALYYSIRYSDSTNLHFWVCIYNRTLQVFVSMMETALKRCFRIKSRWRLHNCIRSFCLLIWVWLFDEIPYREGRSCWRLIECFVHFWNSSWP